ncbi:MAG: Na/Pi symporter, partial [Candidatus Omnitrophica bacterium]|nr:Na/Pi symporter [Candidatus Omnitrophota bacterium]
MKDIEPSSSKLDTYFKIITVLGLVYLFLVSIGLMGTAFKGFGKDFAQNLIQTTANPFVGLFIGILATSLVQSSSTTTSITVGMVSSGVLTVGNAIPIIMGANIGTTVTNTTVALAHIGRREEFKRAIGGSTVHDFFNIICVCILFPLQIWTDFLHKAAVWMSSLFKGFGGLTFTSPLKAITKPVVHLIENFLTSLSFLSPKLMYFIMLIVSILLLFFALIFIVKTMRSLVIAKVENVLNNVFGKSALIAIFAGFIFTSIVQSSSITVSLMVPLVAAGVLTVGTIFPITLGANLGTTTTTILASFATGNIAAITVAFVHFLFNLLGIIIIYPVKAIRNIPIRLAQGLGNLAYKKRRYAIIYVISLFFLIPGILIFISKLI